MKSKRTEKDLEVGMQVYAVQGALPQDEHTPVFVTKSKVEGIGSLTGREGAEYCVVDLGESGIHYMGMTAFFDKSSAYRCASYAQGINVLTMTGISVSHSGRLTDLLWHVSQKMGENWHTGHFAAWEFLCSDCKRQKMDQQFMIRLEISRRIAGIPFVIGSGWRCKKRNAAVGGVEDSSHLIGMAADIMALTSKERFIILDALLRAGFMRIGIAKYYIHVDSDLSKPQGIVYLYK